MNWISDHLLGIFEFFLVWFSAVAITSALGYGAGVDLGWWWALFWAGVGALLGWMKA